MHVSSQLIQTLFLFFSDYKLLCLKKLVIFCLFVFCFFFVSTVKCFLLFFCLFIGYLVNMQ